jgi:hypothetical protein
VLGRFCIEAERERERDGGGGVRHAIARNGRGPDPVAGAMSARRVGRWHDPTTVEMGGWRQRKAKSGGSLIGGPRGCGVRPTRGTDRSVPGNGDMALVCRAMARGWVMCGAQRKEKARLPSGADPNLNLKFEFFSNLY